MKATPPHPSRALAPSWPRRLLCPALVTLGLLSGSSPRAADVVWQDPVSGDFSDPQRWLIDGVPPQHRIPTSDDRILIATTPPIVVNVANSPTVASAHVGESVTLNLQSDLTVRGEFNGSPVIQGPGTLRAGFWTIGVGTAFATLVGARADLVGLSLPGSGFGLMIRSASQVLVANYRDTTLRGRRPIIVDGAGSDWTVFDTISEAPGLEVTVRNGATANLSTVDAVGAFLLESGATVNAVRFDPLHLSVRGGSQLITGDARPRGFGQSLGLGPAEVMASTWTIQGRLTLPGVFGTVLRLGEGGRIQATDLDLVDSARVEIGTAENPAPNDPSAGTLKVANRLRIQDGTLRIRNGTVECGELELHGDGAIQGEVGLDVYDGLINVSGRAIFDTRATVAALSLSAASGVIGPVAGGSGQIVGEDVLLNFGESLIIGGEGGGSLRLKGDFVRPVKARQFILGQSPTGRGAVEFTTSGGDWDIGDRMIVGDQGEGTLTLLGGAFTADSLALTIAQQPGSRGTVNLRGPDTSWLYLPFDSNQALVVGERGKGLLSIDGAALSAATVVIGRSTEDNQAIIVGPAPSLTATPANLNAS
ncbi:MAG: hypothetical protein L6Q38_14640, partial [Nitrospira sp.]|nr:hypothetical protein [Nitrospira sp.]